MENIETFGKFLSFYCLLPKFSPKKVYQCLILKFCTIKRNDPLEEHYKIKILVENIFLLNRSLLKYQSYYTEISEINLQLYFLWENTIIVMLFPLYFSIKYNNSNVTIPTVKIKLFQSFQLK
jgi:hypothetical protein